MAGCTAAAERLEPHAGSTELGIIKQALVLGMPCTSTSTELGIITGCNAAAEHLV